jgi:pyruvate dehydrogenase E2 component (dihydrolipoamide acetyltransferase)
MATEIKLPELGENVAGGDVLEVKVTAGAVVREGQPLLEIEAEKSTVEVPSPSSGRIAKVLVKKGDAVKTGQPLFVIDSVDAGGPAPVVEKEHPPTESTKASASSPVAQAQVATAPTQSAANATQTSVTQSIIPAGPATRRLARELGVDLGLVHGTATGGRVTQEDVKAFVKQLAAGAGISAANAAGSPVVAPPLPDFGKWGHVERQPLDAIRRKTAQQMALAWSLIPHVTHNDLADITDLDKFRKQQDSNGPKLTVTAFALKAVAIALKQFPRFNSTLDLANNQVILKQYYHLGG